MKPPAITCTKTYPDLPFAHRQPKHDGHCALLHGHNWAFTFEFATEQLDECGFVIDFGKLGFLKSWLNERFDHTLVLNEDDPWLAFMQFHLSDVTDPQRPSNGCTNLAKIITLPDCSCEGLAAWLLEHVGALIAEHTAGRVRVSSVIVIEDSKNSAQAR